MEVRIDWFHRASTIKTSTIRKFKSATVGPYGACFRPRAKSARVAASVEARLPQNPCMKYSFEKRVWSLTKTVADMIVNTVP